MYGIVPYNISEIQKGIQFGHAVVEYSLKYFKNEDFQQWAKKHKTFMVMNGGTTNMGEGTIQGRPDWMVEELKGSLNKYADLLSKNKIKCAYFFEPDLNDALTAAVFLADERVFDKIKYPDYVPLSFDLAKNDPQHEKEWVKSIGGKQNVFLREFISKLRFA